jgi:hypothetical protein
MAGRAVSASHQAKGIEEFRQANRDPCQEWSAVVVRDSKVASTARLGHSGENWLGGAVTMLDPIS